MPDRKTRLYSKLIPVISFRDHTVAECLEVVFTLGDGGAHSFPPFAGRGLRHVCRRLDKRRKNARVQTADGASTSMKLSIASRVAGRI